MSKPERVFAALLLFSAPAFAAVTPPSDDAVRQLLLATETHKQVDGLTQQLAGMLMKGALQSLQDEATTAEQRAVVERTRSKTRAILEEEMGWAKLEPIYVQLYRESFTKEEVAGMLAFYKTPAGQAAVTKMPLVGAKAMQSIQARMGPVMQKLQGVHDAAVQEMKPKPDKSPAK